MMVGPENIDASDALDSFQNKHSTSGAIVSFTGQVRNENASAVVETLHLQSYEPLTSENIRAKINEANDRWPLEGICVKHRIGDMIPGDTIVFVATASRHRRAAFEAADFLMDYLKTEAIFWKKETTMLASKWVEPRPDDYRDANRWHIQKKARR